MDSDTFWHSLPLELKHEILIHAAHISMPMACKLRLVSSHINHLMLPIIFRDIHLENAHDVQHLANILCPPIPLIPRARLTRTRALQTIPTRSLSITAPERLPSVENNLENLAPFFEGIELLAISATTLPTHSFWLRSCRILPKKVMLFHFGRTQPVSRWNEVYFREVTHLYTSTLHTFLPYQSQITDMPNLRFLAVHVPAKYMKNYAEDLYMTLRESPQFERFVVTTDGALDVSTSKELKRCKEDSRFAIILALSNVHLEWHRMVAERGDDVWTRTGDGDLFQDEEDRWAEKARCPWDMSLHGLYQDWEPQSWDLARQRRRISS